MDFTASQFNKCYDHPLDVIEFFLKSYDAGDQCALVVVTNTSGGSVRSVGAIIGVSSKQEIAGHISNGCVDSALVFHSLEAIDNDKVTEIVFGANSQYKDLKLPCGGSIELLIFPSPDRNELSKAQSLLKGRNPIAIEVDFNGNLKAAKASKIEISRWTENKKSFKAYIPPKLTIRITGAGVETIALTKLAISSGLNVILWSPRQDLLDHALSLGALDTQHLTSPENVPECNDDQWTAFVLLFHDHDWELELLKGALAKEAFYIGALGSRKTHAIRCARLLSDDIKPDQIDRIKGPIGLIPSLRDASMVAVSTLSEIINDYTKLTQMND